MKDFVYDGGVRVIYGENQRELVAKETARLGSRLLIVPTGSFISSGHYDELKASLQKAGLQVFCLQAGKSPLLSKVKESRALRKRAYRGGNGHWRRSEHGPCQGHCVQRPAHRYPDGKIPGL